MSPLFQKLYFNSGQSSENPHKGAYKQRALQQDTAGNTEEADRTPTTKQKFGWDGSNLETAKVLQKKKKNKTTKLFQNAQLLQSALPGSPFLPVNPSSNFSPALPIYPTMSEQRGMQDFL